MAGLGDRFVERLRRHFELVRGVVQIVDNDCAGFGCHDGNLSYSPFVRLVDIDSTMNGGPNPLCRWCGAVLERRNHGKHRRSYSGKTQL
jgi:hypothetical protein